MNKVNSVQKNDNILFLLFNILILLFINIFKTNIEVLILVFFSLYFLFLFLSYRKLGTIKKMFLSAEVIYETVYFVYAIMASIMFVLDGYVPRVHEFLIDESTIFQSLKLYLNINCLLNILILLNGGVHTIDKYNFKKAKIYNTIKFNIFDLIAIIILTYFYYLHFRNGFSIFGEYFHDLREFIQSDIHNFNSYLYLYMIPYSFTNIYSFMYGDRKNNKTRKIFVYSILILFWGLSLFTDRRNFVNLLLILVLLYFNKISKIDLKKILILLTAVFLLLSISYFRSGTTKKDFNNFLFLSTGEFTLVNYVTNYYINHDYTMQYGSTYLIDTATIFIPRKIYPNKSVMLSEKFKEDAGTRVAFAFNPVAEGIVNFGYNGAIIFVPFVIMFFIKLAYRFSKKHYIYYFIICGESLNFFRGIFSVSIFTITIVTVLTVLMMNFIEKKTNLIEDNEYE